MAKWISLIHSTQRMECLPGIVLSTALSPNRTFLPYIPVEGDRPQTYIYGIYIPHGMYMHMYMYICLCICMYMYICICVYIYIILYYGNWSEL